LRSRSEHARTSLRIATLCLALAVTACSSSGSSADSKAPSSARDQRTASTAPSAVAAARKQAVAAYNAMWHDMAAASETADYQSPRLADHAAGDALSLLVRGVYTNQAHGIVVKGTLSTDPSVTGVTPPNSPSSVSIRDCFDATKWLEYDATSGALKDDEPGGRHLTTATVALNGGTWKVTQPPVGGLNTC
jgi:hypothetical protein